MYAIIASTPVGLGIKEVASVPLPETQNLRACPSSIVFVACSEFCGFIFMLLVVYVNNLTSVALWWKVCVRVRLEWMLQFGCFHNLGNGLSAFLQPPVNCFILNGEVVELSYLNNLK